jgi:hypothetical protein
MREMLSPTGTVIVIGLIALLGVSAVALSINILRRGRLYRRLRPEARPRRWILLALLFLFAVFAIWFPVWISWPEALISRFLLGLFGATFLAVGIMLRWLAPLVDHFVKRRGWPLR